MIQFVKVDTGQALENGSWICYDENIEGKFNSRVNEIPKLLSLFAVR